MIIKFQFSIIPPNSNVKLVIENVKTMSNQKSEIEKLGSNETDVAVVGLKGLLSLVPIIGSILAETITFHIPNQRIDRLENFAKLLSAKVKNMDDLFKENLKEKFNDPKSLPFLEKVLNQVIESESEQYRLYLASIVKNGLTKDTEAIKRDRLLSIVSQINEIEILRLYGASLDQFDNEQIFSDFFNKYEDIIYANDSFDPSEEELEIENMLKSYGEHLVRIGLTTETHSGVKATSLGEAVLNFIDAEENIKV